jgi:predicted aspartyl protease
VITGIVTTNREATIRLAVIGPDQQVEEVETVIDTGFNGFETLSTQVVHALTLPFAGHHRVMLGDGSSVMLDLYLANGLVE